MGYRRIALFLLPMIVLASSNIIGQEATETELLYGFLAGSYHVMGKKPDSRETYLGRVTFTAKTDHLEVVREIGGRTVKGIGKIESALAADEAQVLRVRFEENGRKYETTYLWRSDLDNYARLSGYVYVPGVRTESPGLEALFIDHGEDLPAK
jgi:hypothetical protein